MDLLSAARRAVADPGALVRRIPARAVGVVLLCLATLLAAWMIVPRTGTEPVLVAAHGLDPGTELTGGDVRIAQYPSELVPDGALTDAHAVEGATTGGALASGTPVTRQALVGPDTGLRPDGTVLVPTVFGDAQAVAVVRPGHRLRVFAAGGDDGLGNGAKPSDDGGDDDGTLALPVSTGALIDDAVVTAVSAPSGPAQGSTVVTLAVTEPEASALARAAGAYLSFALLN